MRTLAFEMLVWHVLFAGLALAPSVQPKALPGTPPARQRQGTA
jgi:hypothetical protein